MDWQSIGAVTVALLCGVWALRQFIRPFLSGHTCKGGCASGGCGMEVPLASSGALLHIQEPEDRAKRVVPQEIQLS